MKYSYFSGILSILLLLTGTFAFTQPVSASCTPIPHNTLIKTPQNPKVYYLNDQNQRFYFPNIDIFNTWFYDFSDLIIVSQDCIKNYPLTGNINYRPGTTLLKSALSPDVFAIGPKNTRIKLADEETARALYGDNWGSKIVTLQDWDLDKLDYVKTASESIMHHGMIFRFEYEYTYYYVSENMYLPIYDYDPVIERGVNIYPREFKNNDNFVFSQNMNKYLNKNISVDDILSNPTQLSSDWENAYLDLSGGKEVILVNSGQEALKLLNGTMGVSRDIDSFAIYDGEFFMSNRIEASDKYIKNTSNKWAYTKTNTASKAIDILNDNNNPVSEAWISQYNGEFHIFTKSNGDAAHWELSYFDNNYSLEHFLNNSQQQHTTGIDTATLAQQKDGLFTLFYKTDDLQSKKWKLLGNDEQLFELPKKNLSLKDNQTDELLTIYSN